MTRLIQIHKGSLRRVAAVEEPKLRFLERYDSVYALAVAAIATDGSLSKLIEKSLSAETLDYDEVYFGKSGWKLLTPLDHPIEPARCTVSGTGLTHLGSAKNRDDMHQAKTDAPVTDSMRMFQSGLENGRPAPGQIGIAPEWFYKGSGAILRAHGEPLVIPSFGEDGGEEAELVGLYIVGADGRPWRIGMAAGNEFSDHVFEKKNYLNLAGSKNRTCSFGPELVIAPVFESVPGRVKIMRGAQELWSKMICTGEREMTHSLANLEHHHFKFDNHRRPGDVHVHFFGAHSLSFGDKVHLTDGDVMEISYEGFGRPLRNPVNVVKAPDALIKVSTLA